MYKRQQQRCGNASDSDYPYPAGVKPAYHQSDPGWPCLLYTSVREYFLGRTPNPCIRCNRYVKWEALLHRALSIGGDYIATGHYANVVRLPNGRYTLKKAPSRKDQTYALYNLTQDQLSKTLTPVGDYTKDEIRQMAEEMGLLVASKPDSQDICFIPDGNYQKFL